MNKNDRKGRAARPKGKAVPPANPPLERHLTNETLGYRWECCSATARRRAERLGIPRIKLSQRSALYRLADVISAENSCAI
jgi:hypothetical protein